MNYDDINSKLLASQDFEYKNFQSKLMPTVDNKTIIGVRVPILRKIAAELYKSDDRESFLNSLPHEYYEENNIHAYLICQMRCFEDCINELERFLPYVDNWATCDSISPKIFSKHTDELLVYIKTWISSNHVYTVRFAIKMLMDFYSKEKFDEEYLNLVASIKSDKYYVNMMIAWYFATELAFNYDSAVEYLTKHRLDKWVHNKTIQKAIESYRISKANKEYLKKLRRV